MASHVEEGAVREVRQEDAPATTARGDTEPHQSLKPGVPSRDFVQPRVLGQVVKLLLMDGPTPRMNHACTPACSGPDTRWTRGHPRSAKTSPRRAEVRPLETASAMPAPAWTASFPCWPQTRTPSIAPQAHRQRHRKPCRRDSPLAAHRRSGGRASFKQVARSAGNARLALRTDGGLLRTTRLTETEAPTGCCALQRRVGFAISRGGHVTLEDLLGGRGRRGARHRRACGRGGVRPDQHPCEGGLAQPRDHRARIGMRRSSSSIPGCFGPLTPGKGEPTSTAQSHSHVARGENHPSDSRVCDGFARPDLRTSDEHWPHGARRHAVRRRLAVRQGRVP